jgi:radical SAM superfamily enzyme YgiQ (UPF0313 family)
MPLAEVELHLNALDDCPMAGAPAEAALSLLLVVPPQRGLLEGFVSGLVAIANYVLLAQPDVDVRVVDLGLEHPDDLERLVAAALIDVPGRVFVGLTSTTASYQSMLRTAAAFKHADPSVVVITGGPHVTPQDDVVLRHHAKIIDFVVRGEGEVAMVELLRAHPDVTTVPNISYLRDGVFVRNPEAALMLPPDLDRLSPILQVASQPQPGSNARATTPGKFDRVTYVSARGCPLACAFCVVRKTDIRAKSVAVIVEDIRHLVVDHGYCAIAIEDNFFGHQPKRTLELCEAIAALRVDVPFDWDCQTRVESMRRPDVVNAMARAGCTAAYLGVEALVPDHLRYLKKTPHPESYLHVLETEVIPTMLAAGINIYINLQLALPLETEQDREVSLRRLRRLGAMIYARGRTLTVFPQLAVIYPGTPHFSSAVAKGQFGPFGEDVFEAFTAWEEREEPILRYLGEHFAHGVGGIPLGLLKRDALIEGRFELSPPDLLNLSTYLRKLDEVKGVTMFKYGRYLTPCAYEDRVS